MEKFLSFLKFDKNRFIALLISLIFGISFILISGQTTLFLGLERGSIDFRFFLRAPDEVSMEIMKGGKGEARGINPRVNPHLAIVAVDEESMHNIGSWPWPWSSHAHLIKTLNQSPKGPNSILFDIFFIDHKSLFSSDADRVLRQTLRQGDYAKIITFNKKNEEEMRAALKQSPNTFLDYPFFSDRTAAQVKDIKERIAYLDRISWPVPATDRTAPWVSNVTPPLPALGEYAKGMGFANIKYESGDGVNRRMPLVLKCNGRYYPNIDLVILMHYYGIKAKDVDLRLGDAIYLRNISKKLQRVINPARYPSIQIAHTGKVSRTDLARYRFQGTTSHDQWAQKLGQKGFFTRMVFDLEISEQVTVKDLKVWMIPQNQPKAEGQLITHIPSFVVDKKKEVTLGKDILLALEPSNGEIKIRSELGSSLTGTRTHSDLMTKPNASRVIRIPVDEEGLMMINFAGGQESFPSHPFHVFVPTPDATPQQVQEHYQNFKEFDSFEDKIVMVAIYKALGLVDVHKSPYGPMFGIEHHANALNTILNQDFLSQLTDSQNYIIVIALALLFGFLLPRMSIIAAAGLSFFGVLVYYVIAQYVFNKMSLIYGVAVPTIQMMITFSLITVYRVLTEEKNSKYIKSTFSKFVSKTVVNQLLSHPDNLQLGGEDRIITVFFSDIRGFTSISEALTPQQLVNFLNEYLSVMTEIIIKYDGTLDKYMGDAIMAFWGAPLPMEDHAIRACKCSLEMMEQLHIMQEKWMAEGKPPMNIGIGLNTGNATVGNMGSANRMDYTCMGDTVNLGSRLEGINKVYETNIIMSEYTYEQVKSFVIARELDLIQVKGKTQPVRIYELLAMK